MARARGAIVGTTGRGKGFGREARLVRFVTRMFSSLILTVLLCGFAAAETDVDIEKAAKVKAAYLRYIAEFTTWPLGVLDDAGGPIVIGLLGSDPHGVAKILERGVERQGIQAQNRPIEIRRLPDPHGPEFETALAQCHLLFFSGANGVAATWDVVRVRLSERPIVTVGELPGFALAEGMIEFVIDDQESRVRMHIDLDAVQRARLRLSSRLLGLKDGVKIIRRGEKGASCEPPSCRPSPQRAARSTPRTATERLSSIEIEARTRGPSR